MIASPLRPRHRQEPGIAAAGRLAHRGTPYGASLSFATTTHLWPLPDPPSRKPRSATSRTGTARSIPGRALASSVSGSPCQGPGTGLPPPISTSVPGTPAALALGLGLRRPARYSTTRHGRPTKSLQPGGCCDHRANPSFGVRCLLAPAAACRRTVASSIVSDTMLGWRSNTRGRRPVTGSAANAAGTWSRPLASSSRRTRRRTRR